MRLSRTQKGCGQTKAWAQVLSERAAERIAQQVAAAVCAQCRHQSRRPERPEADNGAAAAAETHWRLMAGRRCQRGSSHNLRLASRSELASCEHKSDCGHAIVCVRTSASFSLGRLRAGSASMCVCDCIWLAQASCSSELFVHSHRLQLATTRHSTWMHQIHERNPSDSWRSAPLFFPPLSLSRPNRNRLETRSQLASCAGVDVKFVVKVSFSGN